MLKRYFVVIAALALFAGTAISATSYNVDTAHSNISFAVPILGGTSKVTGKFTDFTVNVNYDEADITKSSVSAVIKATSIDTGIERRDAHLRNPDFFDVEKYPEITFKSTRIEKKGKQMIAHGTFTMHGVSKEISFPFTIHTPPKDVTTPKPYVGFSARLSLNRQDYGVAYRNKNLPAFVGDNVDIQIDLITR
ncbi:MAG TPA: YceI family protein [Blastocatellia bacterium]|nr:YceI family protein [Blastocatellia bacterium]